MASNGVSADLRFEVEDLYNAYIETLDDGPLENWPEMFVDPCLYRLMPRENFDAGLPLAAIRCESVGMLKDRVYSLKETLMYQPRYLRHLVSNIRIKSVSDDGDTIQAMANYAVMETLGDDITHILNSGRYIDTIVRENGQLRFKDKTCVYDSELVPTAIVFPV